MNKKYVVITGASSGIGYETALAFAEKKKHMILVARRKEQLSALQKKIQEQYPELEIIIKVSDLSKKEEVYALYDALKIYEIETWINNAGVGTFGALINNELKQIEQLIQVNIEATTILSILYARDYANKPGAQLINVSSAMGYVIGLGNVAYSASKFYVSVLTEGLAAELKNATLKAKVLAPAYTDTAFIQQSSEKKSVATNIQLRSPQEVATYLLALYESEHILGIVDEKNQFTLSDARFPVFSL